MWIWSSVTKVLGSIHSMSLLLILETSLLSTGMRGISFGSHQLRDSCSNLTISWFCPKMVSMFWLWERNRVELSRIWKVLIDTSIRSGPSTISKSSQLIICCSLASFMRIDRFACSNNTVISRSKPISMTFSRSRYGKSLWESCFYSKVFMLAKHRVRSNF